MSEISIKGMRVARGLTQTQLAEKLGVVQSAVCQWERETYSPKLKHIKALAAVLECSVDDLLKDEDSE